MQQTPPAQSSKTSKAVIVLLVLVIIGLIVTNIRQHMRFNFIEQRVNDMVHMQMSEWHNIRSATWHELGQIRRELEEATRLAGDVHVAALSLCGYELTAEVNVSFFLREFEPGDVVWVKAQSDETLKSVAAVLSENGRFGAYLTLPIASHHSLSFVTEGATIRSGALAEVYLAEDLAGRFFVSFGGGVSLREGWQDVWLKRVWPLFTNVTEGNEGLLLRDAFLYLESLEGEVIRSWNLGPFIQYEADFLQLMNPHDLIHQTYFSVPIVEQGRAGTASQNGRGYLRAGEDVAARLVMYDRLGIRYEISSYIQIPPTRGGPLPPPSAVYAGHLYGPFSRVIEYGEHSWDFVRIVRR